MQFSSLLVKGLKYMHRWTHSHRPVGRPTFLSRPLLALLTAIQLQQGTLCGFRTQQGPYPDPPPGHQIASCSVYLQLMIAGTMLETQALWWVLSVMHHHILIFICWSCIPTVAAQHDHRTVSFSAGWMGTGKVSAATPLLSFLM